MLPQSFASTGFHAHRVSRTPPDIYQVIGERRSGTNVVRKMFQKNVHIQKTEALGWKHGFPRMLGIPANLLTIVCVRDARPWALSMHKRPWHTHPALQMMTFSDFIRSQWCSVVDRMDYFEDVHSEYNVQGQELQFDRHPITGQRFANLFALRSLKLRGHLSMLARGGDVVVLRAEDFLKNPEGQINAICEAFDLERKSEDFKGVRRQLGTRFNSAIGGKERPETPDEMSEDDISFMKEALDLELEKRLGYTY